MHPDGAGLYLLVSESLVKTWIFRFRYMGKRHDMGLGPLYVTSLADARAAAQEARKLLLQGKNPLEVKKANIQQQRLAQATTQIFRACAAEYIESHKKKWKNEKHLRQWQNTLEAYVHPHIGDLAVADITTPLVRRCLEPIWTEKPETATRVRQRIELVWGWAKVMGYCSGDNPARWRGHLDNLLPARRQISTVKHHEALPYQQVADFVGALRKVGSAGAFALELCILTATRTSEVLNARWDEFDLENALWVIPSERMKAKKEHRVPLSTSALEVLRSCRAEHTGKYVFPSPRGDKPLSNMVMMMAKRRLFQRGDVPDALAKYSEITPHGFRSTFRDWAAEVSHYPRDIAEMALAHTLESKVGAAYRRGDALEKRRAMMEDWAKWCERCEVIAFTPKLVVAE